ncbi:MAG: Unknown protein, partial [uncultured Sulfurovum sp.]
ENGQHDEGLLVGDGTEALIYNNWIENGSSIKKGHGVQLNGFGNTHMFNNVVVNLGIDENRTGRTAPFNKKVVSILTITVHHFQTIKMIRLKFITIPSWVLKIMHLKPIHPKISN